MRLAGIWTMVMAVAITAYCAALVLVWAGASLLGWLAALPGVFVGLQVLGLMVVILFEAAEQIDLVRPNWRPVLHEWSLIAILIWLGWMLLPCGVMVGVSAFFGTMFAVRILLRSRWRPVEPVEIKP